MEQKEKARLPTGPVRRGQGQSSRSPYEEPLEDWLERWKANLPPEQRRKVRAEGAEHVGPCPSCGEGDDRFAITEKAGKLAVSSRCGCPKREAVERLFPRDEAPDPPGLESEPRVTLAAFARAKRLPKDFLEEIGCQGSPRGFTWSYRDRDGAEILRRTREYLKGRKGRPHTRQPAGRKLVPLGLDRLGEARGSGVLWVPEGESDTATLWNAGLPALGIPGASAAAAALTEAGLSAEDLVGIRRINVVQERGKAGEDFPGRIASWLESCGIAVPVHAVRLPADDSSEVWVRQANGDRELFRSILEGAARGAEQTTGFRPGADLTDVGNAARFVRQHGRDVRIVPAWRQNPFLIWDGARFSRDTTNQARALAKETAGSIYLEAANDPDRIRQAELVKHAKTSLGVRRLCAMLEVASADPRVVRAPEAFDADPNLLNLPNGILNLETVEFRARDPHDRPEVTKVAGAAFDPEATCTRWTQFLEEVLVDEAGAPDQELIDYVQRFVGYSLTGSTREEVFVLLHGAGRNGKSKLLETLRKVWGDYAGSVQFGTLLSAGKGADSGPNEDLADLQGLRLVCASEADSRARFSEAILKSLTGGDRIKTRRLYETTREFVPTHKIWLAANQRPNVDDPSLAFWQRLKLIPFRASFTGDRCDRNLEQKLAAELSGILNWALEGLRIWKEEGLGSCPAVDLSTERYREEEDVVGAFISDCCEEDPEAGEGARDLHQEFQAWARDSGLPDLTETMFGRLLTAKGFETRKKGQRRVRVGLRLSSRAERAGRDPRGPQPVPKPPDLREQAMHLKDATVERLRSRITPEIEPDFAVSLDYYRAEVGDDELAERMALLDVLGEEAA